MATCPACGLQVQQTFSSTSLKVHDCGQIIYLSEGGFYRTAQGYTVFKGAPGLIQLGSTGVHGGKMFKVAGQVVASEADSLIHYWHIVFAGDTWAMLAEGYGHYAILRPGMIPFSFSINDLKVIKVGTRLSKERRNFFRLIRRRKYETLFLEGEHQFPHNIKEVYSFEIFSNSGKHYEVLLFTDGIKQCFEVEVRTPQELQLANLRPAAEPRRLTCLKCLIPGEIAALPYTYTFHCTTCGTAHVYQQSSDNFVKAQRTTIITDSYITLGSIGILDQIEFKVIGFTRKQELDAEGAIWKEYTLYNPLEGFAYLSEYEGHWIYVKEWPRPPLITEKGKDYFIENNNEFDLFNDYRYKVVTALGEHIYDLTQTKNYKVEEYICPPQMFIKEWNSDEENWFYGEHIEGKKIEAAFAMPMGLPGKFGVGAVDPAARLNTGKLIFFTLLGIAILLFVHLGWMNQKANKELLHQQVYFNQAEKTEFTTRKFRLGKNESNLQVKLYAPVSNSWVEADGTFVNTTTGKRYSFYQSVEYYFGYDDGNWSEGSTNADVVVPEIPAGEYYAELEFTRGGQGTMVDAIDMAIIYDVPLHRNFLWMALALAVAAVILYLRFYYYDSRRWFNSKYTPYAYE